MKSISCFIQTSGKRKKKLYFDPNLQSLYELSLLMFHTHSMAFQWFLIKLSIDPSISLQFQSNCSNYIFVSFNLLRSMVYPAVIQDYVCRLYIYIYDKIEDDSHFTNFHPFMHYFNYQSTMTSHKLSNLLYE